MPFEYLRSEAKTGRAWALDLWQSSPKVTVAGSTSTPTEEHRFHRWERNAAGYAGDRLA